MRRRTIVTVGPILAPVAPAPVVVQPVQLGRTHPERAGTVVEAMTATAGRIHITVSREFLALLKVARAGQSHLQPGATDEDVLKAALELLIARQEKRKACVPDKVKREVRIRDGGKCQWKLADG